MQSCAIGSRASLHRSMRSRHSTVHALRVGTLLEQHDLPSAPGTHLAASVTHRFDGETPYSSDEPDSSGTLAAVSVKS